MLARCPGHGPQVENRTRAVGGETARGTKGSVTEERDKLFTARPPPGDGADVYSASTVAGQAPADLLDLVRSAEEAARLPLESNADEEVVDVSNEAIDAPPSLPPLRAATPARAFDPRPQPEPSAGPSNHANAEEKARSAAPAAGGGLAVSPQPVQSVALPPAASIAILLALTIGALVVFVR